MGYHLTITDNAKAFIVEKGWDEKFGARPLKRAIQKYIEDPLAEEIISAKLAEGDQITLDFKEGETELDISIIKPKIKQEPEVLSN